MADDTTSGGTFRIEADLSPITDALRTLEILSQSFGSQLTGALKSAVIHGRDLDDVLRSIGSNLSGMALNRGLRPLQILTNGLFDDLFSGLGPLMPFAKGGVVSSPGYFPTAGGLGVAGEAGPEAILPLRMFAMLQEFLDVRVAAISGILIGVTLLALLLGRRVGGLFRVAR